MPDAADIQGAVFKNGSATLLARVIGADGSPIQKADIRSARYTVALVDEDELDAQTPVAGHTNVAVSVAALVYDALQTDDLWDVDSTGYNFKHVLNVTSHQAFASAGRVYLVTFTLTPTSGQPILVRFRVHAI